MCLARRRQKSKTNCGLPLSRAAKTRPSESRELYTRTVAEAVVLRLRRAAGAIFDQREFYHNAIDHHIIPKLGGVKLEKLTMLQIQQFYNELLKTGRVQKKNQPELKEHGLSPRMVQCVHVVLNKALEHAVEEKLILANPAKKCKIRKNPQGDEILPEALIGPYLSAAKEHGILAPMYLELTAGLRRGELLALRWEDLTFKTVPSRSTKASRGRTESWSSAHRKRQIPSERCCSQKIQ